MIAIKSYYIFMEISANHSSNPNDHVLRTKVYLEAFRETHQACNE